MKEPNFRNNGHERKKKKNWKKRRKQIPHQIKTHRADIKLPGKWQQSWEQVKSQALVMNRASSCHNMEQESAETPGGRREKREEQMEVKYSRRRE